MRKMGGNLGRGEKRKLRNAAPHFGASSLRPEAIASRPHKTSGQEARRKKSPPCPPLWHADCETARNLPATRGGEEKTRKGYAPSGRSALPGRFRIDFRNDLRRQQQLTVSSLRARSMREDLDRLADQSTQVGNWRNPAFHFIYWTHKLDLRLLDILLYALLVQCLDQSGSVPHRLVRRVPLYPDAYHSRHPHQ